MPTGLRTIKEFHGNMNTTITLELNRPMGSGPEAIVDYYVITIVPRPLEFSFKTVVYTFPWDVVLAHNKLYFVFATAVNCVGESNTAQLHPLYYGKDKIEHDHFS